MQSVNYVILYSHKKYWSPTKLTVLRFRRIGLLVVLATVYTCTREGSPEVSSYVSSLAIGIVMSVEYITTNETKTLVFLMIITL